MVLGAAVLLGLLAAAAAVQHCAALEEREGFLRVAGLAVVRSRLENTQPNNEYRPASSRPDAFLLQCSSDSFDFGAPLKVRGPVPSSGHFRFL